MSALTDSLVWQNLIKLQTAMTNQSLKSLFDQDEKRVQKYSFSLGQLNLDFSKNLINDEVMSQLLVLANESHLKEKIDALYQGEIVNYSENRPALHWLLRDQSQDPFILNGIDLKTEVNRVIGRMKSMADQINQGLLKGYNHHTIKNIVNIGIGGSDLGPESVYLALRDYANSQLKIRFISNIDYDNTKEVLSDLNPDETIFLVSSKTFTTHETLTNALTCRQWLVDRLGADAFYDHFFAITANRSQAEEFGIKKDNIFEFWDWVGGRYSVCSSIGLIVMIAIGFDNFKQFLSGFYDIDQHFKNTPLPQNVPVIMALISLWYNDFWSYKSQAIIPYSYRLARIPAYLQQAVMESNGKSVDRDGQLVDYSTGPIVWGESATNAQHAFFQLFHQGTDIVPVDLIGFINHYQNNDLHNNQLLANLLAQAQALAFGQESTTDHNRLFLGNRPTNIILANKLDPKSLGQIISLYEAKVYCQGVIWHINSFDQFGVELGKKLADQIEASINQSSYSGDFYDASTNNLLEIIQQKK